MEPLSYPDLNLAKPISKRGSGPTLTLLNGHVALTKSVLDLLGSPDRVTLATAGAYVLIGGPEAFPAGDTYPLVLDDRGGRQGGAYSPGWSSGPWPKPG